MVMWCCDAVVLCCVVLCVHSLESENERLFRNKESSLSLRIRREIFSSKTTAAFTFKCDLANRQRKTPTVDDMSDLPATKKAKLEKESESSIGGAKTAADVVPSNRHIISRGAEAVVESITFLDMPAVVKTRVPKLYRIPQLEKMITRERTVAEARCLRRCWSAGLRVPLVLCCNVAGGVIVLEKIMGNTVKKHLLEVCGPEDHPVGV